MVRCRARTAVRGWRGRIRTPNLPGQSRTCCRLHHSPMVWLPGAAPGASRARTGCSPDELEPEGCCVAACGRRDSDPHTLCGHQALDLACLPFHHFRVDGRRATRASSGCRPPPPPVRAAGTRRRRRRVKLSPNHLGAEGETCTRTPRRAPASEAGMSAFHHFRLRPSRGQSLPGVSTPGPGGTKAGGPPGREALCRRGDLHPHASRHRVLGPACLRSTTSAGAPPVGAGWSPPAVLVPRTGFEPVISSLRGRRVGQLHQRGLGSGRHHGGMGRPGRCGACRTRTDRLLIASEVLFLMS